MAADRHGDRWLAWTEAGTWSLPRSRGVPYMLGASGLLDVEFWRIADSLHPDQI